MLENEKVVVEYAARRNCRPSALGTALNIVALLDAFLLGVFAVTKAHQLRQPDPYNNPFSIIAMAALGLFVALWLLMLPLAVILHVRHLRPNILSYIWMVTAGVLLLRGAIRVYHFVNP